ncbi:MAG: ribonuclease III [Thermotogaceae bacterium]|nr:ribonuclease III [Thermotogaceae bacterium]
MTDIEKESVIEFLRKENLCCKNIETFFISLVHSSYANEQLQAGRSDITSNERLEFLGDAVVDLVVCDLLYRKYPDASEGEMSKVKAAVASEKILSIMAKEINLGNYLFLGKGEENTGGRDRDSILADAFEAFLGAVYITYGLSKVKEIFDKRFSHYISLVMKGKLLFDYKTALQELTQRVLKELPEYKVVQKKNNAFVVEVIISNKVMGKGTGRSKKEAEKAAAEAAYKALLRERK